MRQIIGHNEFHRILHIVKRLLRSHSLILEEFLRYLACLYIALIVGKVGDLCRLACKVGILATRRYRLQAADGSFHTVHPSVERGHARTCGVRGRPDRADRRLNRGDHGAYGDKGVCLNACDGVHAAIARQVSRCSTPELSNLPDVVRTVVCCLLLSYFHREYWRCLVIYINCVV